MGDLGIVALVFFVVPGFMADAVYRAARGAEIEKGDLRTLLRSLVWATIGLLGALAVFPGWKPVHEFTTELIRGTLADAGALPEATLAQTIIAIVCAAVAGRISSSDRFVTWFVDLFGTSPDTGGAWSAFLRRRKERVARVTTKSGKTYWGKIFAVGVSPKRDIALVDPTIDKIGDGSVVAPITTARFIYITEAEVAEVWLSPTESEVQRGRAQKKRELDSGSGR
jgi:hypothetical protein